MNASRLPVLFVAHGAPTLAIDEKKGAELLAWAQKLPRPNALLVVSAHWEKTPPILGTTDHSELIYDFWGFPEELYKLTWPAPGFSDELVSLVRKSLGDEVIGPIDRKLDHGVWVPMMRMYPEADIPTMQLSLPSHWSAKQLYDFGMKLAPLRDQGILIVASGNLVHNLRRISFGGSNPPPDWAVAYDRWCEEVIGGWKLDELLNYDHHAPATHIAHPTLEHFLPVMVAAGAAGAEGPPEVLFPVTGFEFGSISRRCVEFR